MNRDDVIRMAREAGLMGNELAYAGWYPEALERFAALVAAAERERIYFETSSDFVKSAVAAEREACAEVADSLDPLQDGAIGRIIRARGNT